jgi:hypothetical protein
MSEWQSIETAPDKPMTVLFYNATMTWRDSAGRVIELGAAFPSEPYREERVGLGFWDGECWRWIGSGHAVWEWPDDDTDPNLPTHWMPLPPPPQERT